EAPRVLNSHPPKKAPITPTTRSPMTPKPPPLTSIPANQPATRPTTRNHSKLMALSLLRENHDTPRPVAGGDHTRTQGDTTWGRARPAHTDTTAVSWTTPSSRTCPIQHEPIPCYSACVNTVSSRRRRSAGSTTRPATSTL